MPEHPLKLNERIELPPLGCLVRRDFDFSYTLFIMPFLHAIYEFFIIIIWQDWFAFLGNGSDFNFTLAGEAVFPNSGAPTVDNNYGFCQVSVSDMHLSVTLLRYVFVCSSCCFCCVLTAWYQSLVKL